jgi:hypothetical protein
MTVMAAWQIRDAATRDRKRLLAAGFMPVPAVGKAVLLTGWSQLVPTPEMIDRWFHEQESALNTGIMTRTAPAVDVDVFDEEVAREIEEALWEMIGTRAPVRFGQPPKRAVLFRTETPFKKIVTIFTSPSGLKHKVEILGDGQQIVALGAHPDTAKPYTWYGGTPGEFLRADLPELTEAMAREFISRAAAIMRAHEWTESVARKPNGDGRHAAVAVTADDGGEFDQMYGGREQSYALAALQGCAEERPAWLRIPAATAS